jgi:hypothetical protein
MTAKGKNRRPGSTALTGDRGRGGGLRRRVTEIPREVEDWFWDHSTHGVCMARELARAELTASRDGYIIRWVHPWACQLLEPGPEEILIATAHGVFLRGTPQTDPVARKVERQLMKTAGLGGPDGPGCVIAWEQQSVCQVLEPDGVTVISECGDYLLGVENEPRGREIAAWAAMDAGI